MSLDRSGHERKLVSVLFADLAGSTELATRHDPEDLRNLLVAFFDEMAQQVRVFGGTVEQFAGDAVMAVFGVPLEEGAAHRARGQVYAALGHRQDADAAFRRSAEILDEIQALPELAQTRLAYGRFRARDDPAEGRRLVEEALRLFEAMEAVGWVAEAQAALSAL